MPGKRRGSGDVPLRRSCGTMAVHMMLLEKYPSFRARQFRLEQDFARRRSAGVSLDKLKAVTVGVVVNVVYKTDEQNISDAQVREPDRRAQPRLRRHATRTSPRCRRRGRGW